MKYIDISYPMHSGMSIYPKNPGFFIEKVHDIAQGDSSNVSMYTMGTHTGTHIDAPAHAISGGKTIDALKLEQMNGTAQVVHIYKKTCINIDDLQKFRIEKNEIILLKTDNSMKFSCDCILDDYVTLSYGAAQYLAERQIKMVGIDYMSIERPRSSRRRGKSIHKILLGAGVLICETLMLKTVSPGRYYFYCMPINLVGADGVPVRAVLRREDD